MLRDHLAVLPDISVVADFLTTRVVLATAFIGAFVNTGVPSLLSALALVSLLVFFIFEFYRVRAHRAVTSRLKQRDPPGMESQVGQQRAIVRALGRLDECVLVTDANGFIVAVAGRPEIFIGYSARDLVGVQLDTEMTWADSRITHSTMILDASQYNIIKATRC